MPRPVTYYGSFIQRAVLSVSVLMIMVHLQYTAPTLRALWLLYSDSKNNMHNMLPIIIPKFALSKFFPTLEKKRKKKKRGGGGGGGGGDRPLNVSSAETCLQKQLSRTTPQLDNPSCRYESTAPPQSIFTQPSGLCNPRRSKQHSYRYKPSQRNCRP